MRARFIRAVGLFVCVTGLGLVLILAASRFYFPAPANAARADPENGLSGNQDLAVSSSAGFLETDAISQPHPKPVIAPLDAPLFSVPLPEQSPTDEIASSKPSLSNRKTALASPLEQRNAITRLVIPDLRLDAQVKYIPFEGNTWDLASLGQSVAWLGNIAGDQAVRNVVLAGHVTVWDGNHGPFRYLSRLTPGAQLTVYSERYIYSYRVRELAVVNPEDAYITEDSAQSQLTLLTCTTWNEKTKSYLRRQVVIADLVKVEPYPLGIMD